MTQTHDHAKQIRKALLTITAHYDTCLEPVRRASGGHATAAAFPSLPISTDVLDKRATCRNRLAWWSRLVVVERDLHTEYLSGHDVQAMADLLQRHSDWLADHPSAGDAATQLEASAHDMAGIAKPHHREWMPIGNCPLQVERDGHQAVCGGRVRAYPHLDPACDTCGTKAVTSWWEQAMFIDPELTALVTAPAMVVAIHREFGRVVVESTLRQWVNRGFIATSGKDELGRNLYDRAGVVYALARRKVIM